MKMSKKTKWIIMGSFAAVILLVVIVMIVLLAKTGKSSKNEYVRDTATIEVGEEFDPSVFLKTKKLTATVDENSVYDLSIPGEYALKLHLSDGSEASVLLTVKDTVPPKALEQLPVIVAQGSKPAPELLLPAEYIDDKTEVRVSVIGVPATAEEGPSTIALRLEDRGGNVTKVDLPVYVTSALNTGYYYEIGTDPPSAETLLPGTGASQIADGMIVICDRPQVCTMCVAVFGGEYVVRYYAKDTVSPTAVQKEGLSFTLTSSLPEDPKELFEEITDATEVTAVYFEEYLLNKVEDRTIKVRLIDAAGNTTTVPVLISVYDPTGNTDVEPPVISGVRDFATVVGVQPDYLAGISVYDNKDGDIPINNVIVDSSAVLIDVVNTDPGYEVIYKVTDRSGNLATATAHVRVRTSSVSEEVKKACFDEVMKTSFVSGAATRAQVLANIYKYVTVDCALSPDEANAPGDYEEEAYYGFTQKRGNDQTYCAMARVILDRLGYEYIPIDSAASSATRHSWLLVDYAVGWMHFDPAPLEGFVWTKDGKVYAASSEEGKAVDASDMKRKEALTDADLEEFNAKANEIVPGSNYYASDTVRPASVMRIDGNYRSPSYTVVYTAGGGGTLTGELEQTYLFGQSTTEVTASPNVGYKFVSWDDGLTTPTRTDIVKRDKTIRAIFELDSEAVTYHTVTYTTDGHGSIKGYDSQRLLSGKMTSMVTAVPAQGYYFISWDDGLTTAERSDKVEDTVTYTATFGQMLIVSYRDSVGGTVSGQTMQYVRPYGTGTPVTAVPNKGFMFVSWSDGSTEATRTDSIEETGLTLTATFAPDTTEYVVTYVAGEGGRIGGQAQQSVVSGESTQTVVALANDGYRFVRWSDGKTQAMRSDEVYGAFTLTAIFEKLPDDTTPDDPTPTPDEQPGE